jgi:hypothetical protein
MEAMNAMIPTIGEINVARPREIMSEKSPWLLPKHRGNAMIATNERHADTAASKRLSDNRFTMRLLGYKCVIF